MARTKGSNNFSGTLEALAGGPLDARAVVPTKADLTTASNFPYPYVGMIVSVTAEGKAYLLTATPVTTEANWKEIGSGGSIAATSVTYSNTSSGMTATNAQGAIDELKTDIDNLPAVFTPAGSVAFASLPSLTAGNVGKVVNVTDAFTTTSNFVEGSGKSYPAGTNVAVVDVGSGSSHSYKYDAMSGFVDLSGKADKVSGATSNNFAKLDSNGNLADSGKKASDFQATLTAGTGIAINGATISVNGALSGINYSTSEQDTGLTWIDGKKIYQKTFTGSITTYTDSNLRRQHQTSILSNVSTLVSSSGGFKFTNGTYSGIFFRYGSMSLAGDMAAMLSSNILLSANAVYTNIMSKVSDNGTTVDYIITLQYTKTS